MYTPYPQTVWTLSVPLFYSPYDALSCLVGLMELATSRRCRVGRATRLLDHRLPATAAVYGVSV